MSDTPAENGEEKAAGSTGSIHEKTENELATEAKLQEEADAAKAGWVAQQEADAARVKALDEAASPEATEAEADDE